MSTNYDDAAQYVARQLMSKWFPQMGDTARFQESEGGQEWWEIALEDARASIEFYEEWKALDVNSRRG